MSTAVLDALRVLESAASDFLKVTADFGSLAEHEFLDAARDLEGVRRSLETADYAVIGEIGARGLVGRELTRTVAGYLSQLLKLTPVVARTRVREAEALAPRTTLTGEPLAPLHPVTAAARECGALNSAQTQVTLDVLDALPAGLPAGKVTEVEHTLIGYAASFHANDLRLIGHKLVEIYDPDGPVPVEQERARQQRRRTFTLTRQADGMYWAGGLLDAQTGAKTAAVFGALAAPHPDDATGRDDRTPGQRRHDAFAQVIDLALRAKEVVTHTGAPVTVHVTMTAEQFESRTGHCATSFGQRIHVAEALRMADHAAIAWLVHDSRGSILRHGHTKRLATRDQADALLARDGGCAFPNCDQPPEWSQRHHIREWIDGGETDIGNLVLLCPYHHYRHLNQGWVIRVENGVPWFIPPPIIDPHQTPLRNIRALSAQCY